MHRKASSIPRKGTVRCIYTFTLDSDRARVSKLYSLFHAGKSHERLDQPDPASRTRIEQQKKERGRKGKKREKKREEDGEKEREGRRGEREGGRGKERREEREKNSEEVSVP